MFRHLTATAFALTLASMLPAGASAQNFFAPYGCANGRCGTSYYGYGATPYVAAPQYGNVQYNQGILPGGCYQSPRQNWCGTGVPCAQHGVAGCTICQNGVCRQVPCTQHGVVNCPQCQNGVIPRTPSQYNLNGYTGSNYPTVPTGGQSSPYFQPVSSTSNPPAQTLPAWTAPVSTYSSGMVNEY